MLDTDEDKIKDTKYSSFVGGYGQVYWTLQGLIRRAKLGLAFINRNIDDFIFCKFLNAHFYLIPLPSTSWVMTVDPHFSANQKDYQKRINWAHPLKLITTPGRIFCPCLKRKSNKLFYKKKIVPPVDYDNQWRDKSQFANVQLLSYTWSTIELTNPIGDPDNLKIDTEKEWPVKNRWFKCKCATWMDRTKWGNLFTNQNTKSGWDTSLNNWFKYLQGKWFAFWGQTKTTDSSYGEHGPFCPVFYNTDTLESMGFFYKVNFLFTGHSVQATDPGSAGIEINSPKQCNGGGCPTSCTCYRHGTTPDDYSPGGTLSSQKFRELTECDLSDSMDSSDSEESEEEEENIPSNISERILELFRHIQEKTGRQQQQ